MTPEERRDREQRHTFWGALLLLVALVGILVAAGFEQFPHVIRYLHSLWAG